MLSGKEKKNSLLQTDNAEYTAGVVLVLAVVNCHATPFSPHR